MQVAYLGVAEKYQQGKEGGRDNQWRAQLKPAAIRITFMSIGNKAKSAKHMP